MAAINIDVDYYKNLGFTTLYAMAAIFGMIGGCGAGLHYTAHQKHPRFPFILAYMLIGAISGVAYFAVAKVFNIWVATTIHELILNCIIVGSACSFMMFTANTTVSLIFKYLGIEVRITARKDEEERRTVELEKNESVRLDVQIGEERE